MKKFFRDYFSFNQVELKGIRVLLIILVALVVIYFLMPVFLNRKEKFDFTLYKTEVDSFMASATIDSIDEKKEYKKYNRYRSERTSYSDFQMKPFDPNGLPLEIWIEMGLSEKQAQVIKNYEAKGGKFRKKEDVKKQFVISDKFYQKIEPYLIFAEMNDEVNPEHTPLSIDINHAPKEDWVLLNGIGDKLADRIIQYRDQLGGFHSVDQLKEVWGLKEETFNTIQSHCFITTYSLKKIPINLADNNELYQHPYIRKLASSIIDYRKKHGIFNSAEDFKRSGLVDETLYVKLVPYLSFIH